MEEKNKEKRKDSSANAVDASLSISSIDGVAIEVTKEKGNIFEFSKKSPNSKMKIQEPPKESAIIVSSASANLSASTSEEEDPIVEILKKQYPFWDTLPSEFKSALVTGS